MNWAKRRRFVVRSMHGYRDGMRKPTTTWHVYDRAYGFELLGTYKTRQAARDYAQAKNLRFEREVYAYKRLNKLYGNPERTQQ